MGVSNNINIEHGRSCDSISIFSTFNNTRKYQYQYQYHTVVLTQENPSMECGYIPCVTCTKVRSIGTLLYEFFKFSLDKKEEKRC